MFQSNNLFKKCEFFFIENCSKNSNVEESKNGKVVPINDNLTVTSNAKNFQSAINNYFTTFNYWSLLHSSEAILKGK